MIKMDQILLSLVMRLVVGENRLSVPDLAATFGVGERVAQINWWRCERVDNMILCGMREIGSKNRVGHHGGGRKMESIGKWLL